MNAVQIERLGAIFAEVQAAEQVGLVLVGGVRALIAAFHAQPSAADLDAIEASVLADATKRKGESDRMSGKAE